MEAFIINLLQTTLTQLIGVFGIFFVFGFLLYYIQHKTHGIYQKTVGWKGILWTAWIGTPIHELSHAIVAKLFFHKINEIRIFAPNKDTGGLGHIEHSHGKFNLWGRIGLFFIGAAPMIVGSLFLVLMFRYLLPGGGELFLPVGSDASTLGIVWQSIKQTLAGLLRVENLTSWPFWLFLYISFCIASHISPSKQDQKNMWHGLAWLVLILLILNSVFLYVGVDITGFILKLNHFLGIFIAIFTYALIISLLHLGLAAFAFLPFRE